MQVMRVFEVAGKAFPGAEVRASTFEAFVDRLAPFASLSGMLTPSSVSHSAERSGG